MGSQSGTWPVSNRKKIGEKEVILEKYKNLGRSMRLFEAVISKSEMNTFKMAYYGAYYSIFQNDLKKEAIKNTSTPQDEIILNAWNYPNVRLRVLTSQKNAMVKKFMEFAAPSVNIFRELFFYKACSLSLFKDLEKKMLASEAKGKFDAEDFSDLSESFFHSYEKIWKGQCDQWNFLEKPATDDYARATMITQDDITFYKNGFTIKEAANPGNLLFFIGGGGFIASTDSLQEMFLRTWSKQLKCTIFELHYRLAPEKKFPYQLHEVLESYLSIVYYYKHYLGIELKNVTLIGDSAGGNLVMSLMNLLILFKQRVPDCAVLIYPACNLDDKRFTPSLLNSFNERLLYFTVLEKCLGHYIPLGHHPKVDWLISPGVAPDAIMKKYPPTFLICGEYDPLFDDCYRLGHRLQGLKVPTRMYVGENLFHGFLGFDLPLGQGISEVSKIHDMIRDLVLQTISSRNHQEVTPIIPSN